MSRGKDCSSELTNNIAAIHNHRDIVRFNLEEVDYEYWKCQGHILFKSAAERNDKEMMAILIEKGVKDDQVKNYCGGTSESEADSDEDSDVNSDEDDGS